MAVNRKMMGLFRASIAYHQLQKKQIARELEVSPSRLSEWLSADKPMPLEIRERMIDLLGLRKFYGGQR